MYVTINYGETKDELISVSLYEEWNQISVEHHVDNADYMYYVQGKDSVSAMIDEILAVLKAE